MTLMSDNGDCGGTTTTAGTYFHDDISIRRWKCKQKSKKGVKERGNLTCYGPTFPRSHNTKT